MAAHNQGQASTGVNEDGRVTDTTWSATRGSQDPNWKLGNVIGEFKMPNLGPNRERLLDADAVEDTTNASSAIQDHPESRESHFPAFLHEDIIAGLIEMGFDRFNRPQANILRSFVRDATPVQVTGDVRACGTTTAALVAIADQVVKQQCGNPQSNDAANSHGRSAPVAVCAFDTQEQAQEANKFLRQILIPVNKKLAAEDKLQIHVGLFQGGLSGGRFLAPATNKSDTPESSGQILCATPGRLMDSYKRTILKTDNLRFFFAKNIYRLIDMKDFCKGALLMLKAAKNNNQDVRVITTSCTLTDQQRVHLRKCIFIFNDTAPTTIFLHIPSALIKNTYEFVRVQKRGNLQELWNYVQDTWTNGRGQEGRNLLIFTETIIQAGKIARFLRRGLEELMEFDDEEAMQIVGELHSKLPFGTGMGQKIRSHHGYSQFNKEGSGMRFLVATPLSYDLEYNINPDVLIIGVDNFTLWNFFQSRTGRRGFDGHVITFIDAEDDMERHMASQILQSMVANSHAVPTLLTDMCGNAAHTSSGHEVSPGAHAGSAVRGRPNNTPRGNTVRGNTSSRGNTARGNAGRGNTRGRGNTAGGNAGRGNTRGRGNTAGGNTTRGNTRGSGTSQSSGSNHSRDGSVSDTASVVTVVPVPAGTTHQVSPDPIPAAGQANIDYWHQLNASQPVSPDPIAAAGQANIDDWHQLNASQPASNDSNAAANEAFIDSWHQFNASQATNNSSTSHMLAGDDSHKVDSTTSEDGLTSQNEQLINDKNGVDIDVFGKDAASNGSPVMSGAIPALSDSSINSHQEEGDQSASMQPSSSMEGPVPTFLPDLQTPMVSPVTSDFTKDGTSSSDEGKTQEEANVTSAPPSPSGEDTSVLASQLEVPSISATSLPTDAVSPSQEDEASEEPRLASTPLPPSDLHIALTATTPMVPYTMTFPTNQNAQEQVPVAPVSPSPSNEEDEATFFSAPPSPVIEDTARPVLCETSSHVAHEDKVHLESPMSAVPAAVGPVAATGEQVAAASSTTRETPGEKDNSKAKGWRQKLFNKSLARFQSQ
ncbi:hypothetical protein KC326_g7991 [Hortaea werneckii]|nr:hypothetical protein KC326_g7991 [Hortaea werneckii]